MNENKKKVLIWISGSMIAVTILAIVYDLSITYDAHLVALAYLWKAGYFFWDNIIVFFFIWLIFKGIKILQTKKN